MSVVTAADIERMNAHSLAEVLNTINGVQVWFGPTTPGNDATTFIQGSDQRHVAILIDGIIQTFLFSNQHDIGIIPVQMIEKIEIVKGPASSAWGSALGGVINVITKNPVDSGLHGIASVSYGTRNTEDYRAEISGKKGDLGLYLTAGGIHSDGLRFGSAVLNNNIFGKLTYAISPSTDISSSLFYLKGRRDRGDFRESDEKDNDRAEQYFGTVSLTSRLTRNLVLDVSAYAQRQRSRYFEDFAGVDTLSFFTDDRRNGGSAKLVWKSESNTVVFGSDYNNGTDKSDILLDGKQNLTRWALFANDTITIGDFAVTPGARYEHTNTNGDFVSPSLGATYMLARKTILRATVARGFNIPALGDTFGSGGGALPNPNLEVEKVMSYQVGAETGELKYVWVKISLFRHDLKDVLASIDSDGDGLVDKTVNQGRQRRQGFEAEVKTVSVYNTTLSGGTTYISAKDRDTNEVLLTIPQYTYDIGISYDDNKSLRAQLKGRYIWWNTGDYHNSKYSNFNLDLNIIKTIYKHKDQKLEAFMTAHNLLNANQYMVDWYRNAGLWAEVGVRYKF
jgi:vitamin B12 transporter